MNAVRLRIFFAEDEGWHHSECGTKTSKAGRDTKLVTSQCHRKDGSKFSMHVVCPTLLFDRSTLVMKSFVTDLSVYGSVQTVQGDERL